MITFKSTSIHLLERSPYTYCTWYSLHLGMDSWISWQSWWKVKLLCSRWLSCWCYRIIKYCFFQHLFQHHSGRPPTLSVFRFSYLASFWLELILDRIMLLSNWVSRLKLFSSQLVSRFLAYSSSKFELGPSCQANIQSTVVEDEMVAKFSEMEKRNNDARMCMTNRKRIFWTFSTCFD